MISDTQLHLPTLAAPSACEERPCLVINRPDWYRRDDFRIWFQAGVTQRHTAHWADNPASEYADVFMTFDGRPDAEGRGWDGSDTGSTPDLPDDIYRILGRIIRASGHTYGVIWLQNLA